MKTIPRLMKKTERNNTLNINKKIHKMIKIHMMKRKNLKKMTKIKVNQMMVYQSTQQNLENHRKEN